MYPRSICQLRTKHVNLMTRWNDLTAEVESINHLGRQTWSGAFSLVWVRADQLLEEQDLNNMETIKQCMDIIKQASRDKLLCEKYLKVKAELEQSWAMFQEKAGSKFQEPDYGVTPLDLKCTAEAYPAIPIYSLSSNMSSLSSPTFSASTRDTPIVSSPSPILKYNGLSPMDISFIKTEVELVRSCCIEIMPTTEKKLGLLSPIQLGEGKSITQGMDFALKIDVPKPAKSKPGPVEIHSLKLSEIEDEALTCPMESSTTGSPALVPQVISTFPMLSPRTLHSSPLFPNLDFLTAAFGQDGFEPDLQSFIERTDQTSDFEPFGPPPLTAKSQHREYSLYHPGVKSNMNMKSTYFSSPPPLSPVPRRGRIPLPTIIDGDIQDSHSYRSNAENGNRRRMSTSMVNEKELSKSPSLLAMSTPRRNTIEHGKLAASFNPNRLPSDWNLRSANPAPSQANTTTNLFVTCFNATDTALLQKNPFLDDYFPCDPLHRSLVSLSSPHLRTHPNVKSLALPLRKDDRLISVSAPSVNRESQLDPLQLPLRISSLRT